MASVLLKAELARCGPLRVTAVAESGEFPPSRATGRGSLPDDTDVALVGAVGSPTVMTERLPSGEEFALALHRLEAATGRTFGAVAPLEIGGVNGLLGLVAGARAGRPVLDADGMGRAFARLDQCVLTGHVEATPMVLADPCGGSLVLEGLRPGALARTVEAVLPALGTWAAIACFPTTIGVLRRHAVVGSVGRALRVGRMLRAARDCVGDIRGGPRVTEIGSGSIVEVLRPPRAASGGTLTIVGEGPEARTLRVDHGEEFEAVTIDGVVAVVGPDLVVVCDSRTWLPLGVADVRVGQRVRVLTAPVDARSRGGDRAPVWADVVAVAAWS